MSFSRVGAYQNHMRVPRAERLETATDKQCAVCLEDIMPSDSIFWPTCGHFGHEKCISNLPACATCRKPYLRAVLNGSERLYELVRGAVPALINALARYRDRLVYVMDDDDFDEKVCGMPIRVLINGLERDVHLTVWITAYGLVSELVDDTHRRRVQLTGFVPIEGGLQPDAPSCDRAMKVLSYQMSIGLRLSEIELQGLVGDP